MNRRTFIERSLLTSIGSALALPRAARAQASATPTAAAAASPSPQLPGGTICGRPVGRLLLGGNLLTHFTHSRDLRYVYALAAHYNTEAKILDTLETAEAHGIDTLVIHTVPDVLEILYRYRQERGGEMRWIICPTAPIEDGLAAFRAQVEELVANGVDAIYIWGVRGDELTRQGRVDLIAAAVQLAKGMGKPCGVGAHDISVIVECEKQDVPADFYIKTFHHHNYPTAPKPEQIAGPYAEIPGYWCSDPAATAAVMQAVEKPWIAFKVMAAGAIPPADAFQYAFNQGADHVLAGMFDFEIAEDVILARNAVAAAQRTRPWRS